MKNFITTAVFLMIANSSFANEKDFVHHPAPKEPSYLSASLYESFKNQVPAPPAPKSKLQLSDEQELFNLQTTRTTGDCAQAKVEVFVSLGSFYGSPRGSLNESDVKKLSAFFEQVRNDGDYFIQKMKKDFPRQRPFAYIKGITPCIPKEVTGAYPSGHATLAKLYAAILGDFFPSDKEKFEKRSIEIGRHRVLSGMHHPTDIESGRKLADMIYRELKQSKKFQAEFKEISKQIGR